MKKTSVELEKTLRDICFKIKIEGRKVLKRFDISSAQFDLLQLLYFKGEKKLSDISKKLGVTKSTTTGLIKRLLIQELIEKKQSDEDKRVYNVKISKKGSEIIEEVIDRRVDLIRKITNKMGKDDSFIEKLIELDKTLNEVVEGDEV
ncbi:MarR family winged helix-turn-helix transcriptional regulator [Geotoga petraea]|uniref:DNA-binding transcriptional regulator, MarR family n=1 Tax=Geotoga petraea TaxID=28234 RepID=A0A1G6ILV3_9BACT|nr:MarR family transcriptional regulator [Geotoga petraea]MDK2945296.1 MarR family transcriptional regulator, organic hydroperoxide resistance regulator [Geotoga sp.]TGG89241.1 MarR family transcriptional regulator [Geotoga petraea]SDC07423.1 DNA-binding transcriptional regulator, MarR family [Geotoga petraea]